MANGRSQKTARKPGNRAAKKPGNRAKRVDGAVRRRQLLDTAAQLFHERGYTATSMDDVAEAVGLSKGTLYHHFNSKAEILQQVYEESLDFVLERIRAHPKNATPAERIRLLISDTLDLVESRRHYVTVYYQEMRWLREWLPGARARSLERKMREYRQYIREVIREGIEDGEFRDIDPVVAGYALLGMASWTYQWFEPSGRIPRQQVVDLFTTIYLRGMSIDGEGEAVPSKGARKGAGSPHRVNAGRPRTTR